MIIKRTHGENASYHIPRIAIGITMLAILLVDGTATADNSSWSIVSPGLNGSLSGVAAVSANNIWAVGMGPSIKHWDGNNWSVIDSPPSPTGIGTLSGVAVVSNNDVWAVGVSMFSSFPIIEHWNGINWSIVPSLGYGDSGLDGIAVVSANDIWAVGTSSSTLIEHWDGSTWSVIPSPNPAEAQNSILYGVAVVSANDIWAVGSGNDNALIEHWNGINWSIVPSPNGTYAHLLGIAAVSANDIWAVGVGVNGTLTDHWDGSTWSVVPSPNGPNVAETSSNMLNKVAVVSANDIWAVGSYFTPSGVRQTLTEHWDGNTWKIVQSPNQGSDHNQLLDVTAISTNDIWTVGDYGNGVYSLFEHYGTNTPTQHPHQHSTSQGSR
jgi:hypothetical protein